MKPKQLRCSVVEDNLTYYGKIIKRHSDGCMVEFDPSTKPPRSLHNGHGMGGSGLCWYYFINRVTIEPKRPLTFKEFAQSE